MAAVVKFVFIFCFALFGHFEYSRSFVREKVLQIDRFTGLCEGYEDVLITLHNLSFRHSGKSTILNGKLVVKHDLNNEIEANVSLTRCPHKDSLDSCEGLQNMRFARCCNILNARGQVWSNFVESIQPNMRCPVNAGIYSINNATFDVSFTFFPLEGYYWKLSLNSFDVKTKEQVLCLKIDCQVVFVTKRN